MLSDVPVLVSVCSTYISTYMKLHIHVLCMYTYVHVHIYRTLYDMYLSLPSDMYVIII